MLLQLSQTNTANLSRLAQSDSLIRHCLVPVRKYVPPTRRAAGSLALTLATSRLPFAAPQDCLVTATASAAEAARAAGEAALELLLAVGESEAAVAGASAAVKEAITNVLRRIVKFAERKSGGSSSSSRSAVASSSSSPSPSPSPSPPPEGLAAALCSSATLARVVQCLQELSGGPRAGAGVSIHK